MYTLKKQRKRDKCYQQTSWVHVQSSLVSAQEVRSPQWAAAGAYLMLRRSIQDGTSRARSCSTPAYVGSSSAPSPAEP